MALENKLLRDAQGRPMMNEFQNTVFIAEQVADQVQRVIIALKNAGYRLPKLVSISVDGQVAHLTDDPTIKKAIIKRARKAGMRMADVEIAPNATPGQVKAAEDAALAKQDMVEEKIDEEVEAASKELDNDLEAFLICEKPEARMSKKARKLKAQGAEHLEARVVMEAAERLSKSTNPEDQASAKRVRELLMGPEMPETPADPAIAKAVPNPKPSALFFDAMNREQELRELEAKAQEEAKAKEKPGHDKPGK